MQDFLVSREDLLERYQTDQKEGLSYRQAEENKKRFGENTLTKAKPQSLLVRVWNAATEPIILMLIMAGVIALIVNVIRGFTGEETDYLECVGIFAAISLSVSITVVMEGRSQKAFDALNAINENIIIRAVREGIPITLKQAELAAGDIIDLTSGDKVPADARLLESSDLEVDESALTGESVPVLKDANKNFIDVVPLAERENMVYGGTYITSGMGRALVTRVGDETEIGKIASELRSNASTSTPLQEKLTRLGKQITVLGIIAATIVFISEIISFFIHNTLTLANVLDAFVTSVVLIVAAVPEGLPTIVAVSLSINIIKLARENALVKKMIASETVGCINIICSDKTGTLTENKMHVVDYDKSAKDDLLALNVIINSSVDLGEDGSFIGNPTEGAMLEFVVDKTSKPYRKLRERYKPEHVFPFSSNLKRMTSIVTIDNTNLALIKGSPEYILSHANLKKSEREKIESRIHELEKQAMRIIALGHKEIDHSVTDYESEREQIEDNIEYDGFFAIADPLRSEVLDAVKLSKDAGIELKILTGDNIATASAIAEQLHLLEDGTALEAGEIENMNDDELLENLKNIKVIARSTPEIKMRIVRLLKSSGNIVAVTGDGINDAPALKNADVGIAMGISGTEVSKEASDIVLLDDSFATIINAIEWGRNIYENFKRFISFQLTVNVASVIVVFVSILIGLATPFNALELLWINIIMDGPPALTLGLEPNYEDLMVREPTKRDENIITKRLMTRILLMSSYMSIIFLLQYTTNFLAIPKHEQITALFTLFVLFQLFNAFNSRELHTNSIVDHFFENKLMLLIVSIAFILQIVFIQYFGAFFNTVPLSLNTWIKLFITSFTVIIVSETVRLFLRIRARKAYSAR